jgi:hypothetical protein
MAKSGGKKGPSVTLFQPFSGHLKTLFALHESFLPCAHGRIGVPGPHATVPAEPPGSMRIEKRTLFLTPRRSSSRTRLSLKACLCLFCSVLARSVPRLT